jgi:hypothetical protein
VILSTNTVDNYDEDIDIAIIQAFSPKDDDNEGFSAAGGARKRLKYIENPSLF